MPFVADPQWFLQPNLPRQGYLENTASVVWLTGMIYDVSSEPWLAYRPAQVLYMSAYHPRLACYTDKFLAIIKDI